VLCLQCLFKWQHMALRMRQLLVWQSLAQAGGHGACMHQHLGVSPALPSWLLLHTHAHTVRGIHPNISHHLCRWRHFLPRCLPPTSILSASINSSLPPHVQVEALTLLSQLEVDEGLPPEAHGPPPPNPIEPDVRSAVYQAAARSNDWEIYHQLQVGGVRGWFSLTGDALRINEGPSHHNLHDEFSVEMTGNTSNVSTEPNHQSRLAGASTEAIKMCTACLYCCP